MKKLLLILTLMIWGLSVYADNNSERGPEWLDGTWRFKGDIDTFFGVQYMNAVLTIDWKNQKLLSVITTSGKGGGTRISGHYKVYNGAIHVESEQYYIKIDYANKRLEFGNGIYYEKEDYGPKPTPTPKGKKFVNTNKEQIIKGGGWATPTNSRYADYKSYDLKIKGDRIVGYGSYFSNNFKSCDAPFYELTAEDRKEQKLTDNQGRSYEMYVTRCKYIAYINGLTFYFNIEIPNSNPQRGTPDKITIDNITYKLDVNKKKATITTVSINDLTLNLTVPSSIKVEGEVYKVKGVMSRAFSNTKLKSLSIPSSIEVFEDHAFSGLTVETLTLSTSYMGPVIESYAFSDIKNMTSITIPFDGVPDFAFQNCKDLKTITFSSENFSSIGYNAFQGCSNLKNIYFYTNEPPSCKTNPLDNINVYIPKGSKKAYKEAEPWKHCKLKEEL